MNSGCENIYGEVLQSQKDFAYLLLPNTENRIDSQITYTTADKAGLLFEVSTYVDSRCLATLGGSASLYISHIANFFRTMPNTEKVSAGAPGVPDATANARNSVESILRLSNEEIANTFSRLTHEQLIELAPLFRVFFCTIECWQNEKSSNPEKSKAL